MRDPHLTIKGWHHGFIGLGAGAVGLALILVAPDRHLAFIIPSALLCVFGVFVFVDDVVQHVVQHWRPGFRSWVHKLWRNK
jgi:sulfite exporter TauE/SafE